MESKSFQGEEREKIQFSTFLILIWVMIQGEKEGRREGGGDVQLSQHYNIGLREKFCRSELI